MQTWRISLLVAVLLAVSSAGCGGCSKEEDQEFDPLPPRDESKVRLNVPEWHFTAQDKPPTTQRIPSLPPVTVGEAFQVEGTYRVPDAERYRRKFEHRYIRIDVQKRLRNGRILTVQSASIKPAEEEGNVFRYREVISPVRKRGRYALRIFHEGKTLVAEGELQVK